MDFARKQLEKFGWKEGNGLGKDSQGIVAAIKPALKVGKEGMGYDFSKELVDTWWTRAYDDSLKRINIEKDEDKVGVTLKDDDDDEGADERAGLGSDRPFFRMKQRMMKASFPTFSKGAILSNGEMIKEKNLNSSSDESSDSDNDIKKSKEPRTLTDEELFKACGGRTAHKAARFGLKLNGKLARIAAQDEATKKLLCSPKLSDENCASSADGLSTEENQEEKIEKKHKKKKRSKDKPVSIKDSTEVQPQQPVPPEEEPATADEPKTLKKSKKHKKRKYEVLLNESQEDTEVPFSKTKVNKPISNSHEKEESQNPTVFEEEDQETEKSKKKKKKSKKSKRHKNE